jgi:thiol-disulfide isomerase/thioredoxin
MRLTARLLLAATLGATGFSAAAAPAALPPPLAPYAGQVLYLDFWASWCGPCAQSFPWLNDIQARYGKRLHVIAVNVDEHRSDAQRFLDQHPPAFTVVYDPAGELAERYHIAGMPSAVILGADGRVLHQHVGYLEADRGEYEQAIDAAVAGATPAGAP